MSRWFDASRRRWAALAAAATLALVAACGGGGDAAAPGAGSTAAPYSVGAITGFGSIIVNGVRWDDSQASVSQDDDTPGRSSDLKLGMVVEVTGRSIDRATAKGVAAGIRYGSETLGPIDSIATDGGTLVVLGQTVEVTASTVFDEAIVGGVAGLAKADVIEVHGLYDATAHRLVATRIEKKTGATEYRLRGTVSALDTAAKTFTLGSETIAYGAAQIPSAFTLANDVQVKVRLKTAPVNGAWEATKVRPILRALAQGSRPDAEVEGVITVFTSTSSFEINGLKVDATNASFPDGTSGLLLGARVEVKGSVVDGVLVATTVKLEDDDHHGGGGAREFELHGAIEGLKTDAKTFTLRGLTVSYAGPVTYKDGSESRLQDQVRVEVKGTLSADGTRIDATRIEFE